MNLRTHLEYLRPWLWAIAFSLLGMAASRPAEAAALQCTISGSAALSFGTITVPRDAPVGTALGTVQSSTVSVSCPANPGTVAPFNNGWYIQYYPQLTVSTSVAGVWNTGMAGIGIRVIDVTYNNKTLSALGVGGWDDFGPPNSTAAASSGSYTFTYQLVKTAASVTAGGALTIPSLLTLVSHNIPANVTSAAQVTVSLGNTSIVARTCSVTTPSISVTLPSVNASTLSPVGTTQGNTNFSIGLSCQAGANVYVTLTDATTPGNRTSNLSLASGSTAAGVSLRVLNGGAAVSYGPDSAVAGNANQWLVGASTSTTNIPLSAQYISTGTVTPGTVKGLATFTMSYQ